jgi:DNA-binding NtrC family response regulator
MPRNIVLCVDDEPIILRLCTTTVAEAGFRAAVAENGAAGLDAFVQLRDEVCLALVDVIMPGSIDGIELARRIHAIDPTVKVVLMSGYSEQVVKTPEHRPLPLIRKPFLASELIKQIRLALDASDAASAGT